MQSILTFLEELKENNHSAWMKANKDRYLRIRTTFEEKVQFLINQIAPFDPQIKDVTVKQCIFRINRDMRFSKDKKPYKNNMGAYLALGGRHGGYAGYYLHIEPNNQSFLAGGLYHPATDVLKKIRQEIDYDGHDLLKIVQAPQFKQLFGALQGDQLKKAPQGYDLRHPQIHFLKMKSFLVKHNVEDYKIIEKDFLTHALEIFQAILPLNKFLNAAIADTV